MNPKIFETLDFAQVREAVLDHTQTEAGRGEVQQMAPVTNLDQVEGLQQETEEALKLLLENHILPIPRLEDLSPAIKRLELGASLNGKELAAMGRLLKSVQEVHDFYRKQEEDQRTYPALFYWIDRSVILSDCVVMIEDAISESGEVLTTASSELSRIRRQQGETEAQIRSSLNQILKNQASHLSDALITIRNNRYVLPVKAESRGQIKGTIHDQSATGQTFYIEPQTVVRLNNRRSQLQAEEREEINRILLELSGQLMPYYEDIRQNQYIMGKLDFIQARSAYAHDIQAIKPKFSQERHVRLLQARHPLLDRDQVVANDIILGQDYRTLIITGPNTGGKTILLKTLGLLHLMGQAGLHIPADPGSQLGLFDEIFADIGDEQSIEQSLSTFSGHMTNIIDILNQASHESLLLFDELGSGTDPQEGSSLAMAILDYVTSCRMTTMATTHYPELKVYAHETPLTINASMEFNSQSLEPTYRLLIGIPGRSNALEISKRLGLPDHILDKARAGISQDSQSMNEMVANLEQERQEVAEDKEATQARLNQADQLLKDLRQEYDRWVEYKSDLMEKAKREANAKVDSAQKEADQLIQEIRDLQLQQGQNTTIKEHVLIDKKGQFDKLKQPETLKKNKVLRREKKKQALTVGQDVMVQSYGQRGTIIDQPDPKTFTVQMGILKMNIPAKELQVIDKVEKKQKVNVQRKAGSKAPTSLDLRGQRYDQAMSQAKTYLDKALLSNHPMVTIIHGKGTGALRQGVQKLLASHPQVDHYNFSPPNAGGNGSTQVFFK